MLKPWLVLLIPVLTLAACAGTPNRLSKSLTPTAEDSAAPQAPAAAATPLTEADIIAPVPSGKSLQPNLSNADIPLDEIVALLPPDAIPAILPDEVDDLMLNAADANREGIKPEERIIGVSINGESKAFPIPFLSRHEIVNDTIGGQPVAVTW